MNNKEFKQLLDGYLQGRLTNGAKAGIEQWLDEQETVNNSEITWTETDKARLLNKINLQLDELEHGEKKTAYIKVWMRAVAIVLFLVVVSYSIWIICSRRSSGMRTNKVNNIEKRIWQDDTIVWFKD